MTHGELIRKLRKERGMTQTQLSSVISSRATLSAFENNSTHVASDILFAYIERLNVTAQEYTFYLNNNVTPEKEILSQYFFNEVIKKRDVEILARINDFHKHYENSHDFYFCCLSIELKLFLNKKHDQAVFDVAEDMDIIKAHLNRVQQWGHFEISIFSNCLYIFSDEYIRGSFTTLLRRTKLVSSIPTYQNDISIFLNNCIVLELERGRFSDAAYYIKQLRRIASKSPRKIYDCLMCNFYQVLLNRELGIVSDVDSTIQPFDKLGFTEHANELRKFADDVKNYKYTLV